MPAAVLALPSSLQELAFVSATPRHTPSSFSLGTFSHPLMKLTCTHTKPVTSANLCLSLSCHPDGNSSWPSILTLCCTPYTLALPLRRPPHTT